MGSLTLIDADDLVQWADRRDAQAELPALVRDLVLATVPRATRVSFRTGAGVQLGGWDGLVQADPGNAFVPDGLSGWELSVDGKVKQKANSDYRERTNDPLGVVPAQSAFVFATPRRFAGKDAWAQARQRERIWREVCVYDADDLEAWLQQAPAVHVRFSIRLGKRPADAVDLLTYWRDWEAATRPATTAALVLAGRVAMVERIADWLRGREPVLELQGDSREEALAVFAAAVHELPADERALVLSQAVIVRNEAAWDHLAASSTPLILVPNFDSPTAVAHAVREGHRVVLPLGATDVGSPSSVTIPPLSRGEATKALAAAGISEDRARDLAALARRSLTAFRRKLAIAPGVHQPIWAQPGYGRALLPALLSGAWKATVDGDREALGALSDLPYDRLAADLTRWANEPDPPVRRAGDAWYVVSREDAWLLLSRYLARDDLGRLESVALDVLGTPDPRFDLPRERRWQAGATGHVPPWSGLLRHGLAETLAVLGVRGEQTLIGADVSAADYARRIVRDLLRKANADWRLWASLSPVLPLLAEAAPDEFLQAVDSGLTGDQPVLPRLFAEEEGDLLGSSPHTGLLWALETLAWSPEHLGYAARLLAKLARLDPGGRSGPRPKDSLRAVFCLWLPQTQAPLERRLHVIDTIRQAEPEAAWHLMLEVLPKAGDVAHSSARPRWREWCPDEPVRVTYAELDRGVREIAARVLQDAGGNGSRWEELVPLLSSLPLDQYDAAVQKLESLDLARLGPQDRAKIWNALRKFISRHRTFRDAKWARPEEQVNRLAQVAALFEPEEAAARYGWLFGDHPELPEGNPKDFTEHRNAVERAQSEALRVVYDQGGFDAVLALAGEVERPGELGAALGRSGLAGDEEDRLLTSCLAAEDKALALFAHGFFAGCVSRRGLEWARAKLTGPGQGWTPAQRAEALLCFPKNPDTWELATALGPETERHYWTTVSPYGIDAQHARRAVEAFLKHASPYAAVELLALYLEDAPPSLVAEALERVLETPPPPGVAYGPFVHNLPDLLDRIAASPDVDEGRVAQLEWALLPLLRYGRDPTILRRELGRNPEFFADMVGFVFRAEGEEPRQLTEEEQVRSQRAFELLTSWRTIPGSTREGAADADELRRWVRQARELLQKRGRQRIGDEMIGQMLSGSPPDPDGAWPHSAVRDLIEEIASEDLERGIEVGIYNSRGVVSRSPDEGGDQERGLADMYDGYARLVADRWPRTAAMLRRIRDGYRQEALHEDHDARLREDLSR